jgi:hypothetical protein
MTDVPTTQSRTAASRAFLLPMWGYVFFVPLPFGRWAPDGAGWLLLLLGLLAISKCYGGVKAAVPMAVAGLVAWGVAVFVPPAYGSDTVLRGLLILRWGLLAVVSWILGGAAVSIAESAGMRALAESARWRRASCLVAFLVLACAPLVPPPYRLVPAAAFLVAAVAAITVTIGLMSRIVRLGSLPTSAPDVEPPAMPPGPGPDADEDATTLDE